MGVFRLGATIMDEVGVITTWKMDAWWIDTPIVDATWG